MVMSHTLTVTHEFQHPGPLPSQEMISGFFEDDNGDLWVTGNGIYKWQETEKMVRENG